MTIKPIDDQKRDEVLKRMLSTPPKPKEGKKSNAQEKSLKKQSDKDRD